MDKKVRRISWQVWAGLAITVVADSCGQIIWKLFANQLPDTDHIPTLLLTAVQIPFFWILAVLLLAQLFLWLAVLKRADLSFAQPLTSLSYVGVGVLSYVWMGEVWSERTVISVLFILIGVSLVSSSPVQSNSVSDPPP
jgi:drug/metabolite transporter (DMT)-like permease